MEQIIIGLVGLNLTVLIYQERARRADKAALKKEIATVREGQDALRRELKDDVTALRRDLKEEIAARAARTDRRIDRLSDAVLQLTDTVGQLKGRTEVLASTR